MHLVKIMIYLRIIEIEILMQYNYSSYSYTTLDTLETLADVPDFYLMHSHIYIIINFARE